MSNNILLYTLLAFALMVIDGVSQNHTGSSVAICTMFVLGGIHTCYLELYWTRKGVETLLNKLDEEDEPPFDMLEEHY